MRAPTGIARDRMLAVRQWVFRWRGLDGTLWRGGLALVVVSAGFLFFSFAVRVRVSAPREWEERKASILYLPQSEDGRRWALLAQESGPFPARFDSDGWMKESGLKDRLFEATRLPAPGYEPELREVSGEHGIAKVGLADAEERVFPGHRERAAEVPVAARLVPVLHALDQISEDELPVVLPAFEGGRVDGAGMSRFLLRLGEDGTVLECVRLSGTGGAWVEEWLKRVDFGVEVGRKSPWIGIGVGFTNQAADGPDAR